MANEQQYPQKSNRPRVDWESWQTLKDERTGIVIEIRRLPLYSPKFDLVPSFINKDGKQDRFYHVVSKAENGKVELVNPIDPVRFMELWNEALHYVSEELQAIEDRILRAKREKETREAASGKKDMRNTGKTARKKEKMRSRASNPPPSS